MQIPSEASKFWSLKFPFSVQNCSSLNPQSHSKKLMLLRAMAGFWVMFLHRPNAFIGESQTRALQSRGCSQSRPVLGCGQASRLGWYGSDTPLWQFHKVTKTSTAAPIDMGLACVSHVSLHFLNEGSAVRVSSKGGRGGRRGSFPPKQLNFPPKLTQLPPQDIANNYNYRGLTATWSVSFPPKMKFLDETLAVLN